MDESLSLGKGEREKGELNGNGKKLRRNSRGKTTSSLIRLCRLFAVGVLFQLDLESLFFSSFLAFRVFISPSISPASLSGRAENWKVEKLRCCSLLLVYIRLRYNPERRTTRRISGKGIQIEWGKWSFFIAHNFLSRFVLFSSLFHRPTWMKKSSESWLWTMWKFVEEI